MFNRPSDNRSDNNVIVITIYAFFAMLFSAYITYSYFKTRANKKLKSIHIPTKRITQATVSPKQKAEETSSTSPTIQSPTTPARRSSMVTRNKIETDEKGVSTTSSSGAKTEFKSSSSTQLLSSSATETKVKTPRKAKENTENAKTLAIRLAMQQKKEAKEQEKQRADEEEAKLEAAREEEKKLWQEKVLKEKEAARAKAALEAEKAKIESERKKDEAVSSSPVIDSPDISASPKRSVGYEARKAMIAHSLALAKFDYDEKTQGDSLLGHPTLRTLTFLFHFHRYNLCRRILKDMIFDREKSVELRTLLVHTTNRINITPALIMETKAGLCQFMTREVGRVVQVHGSNHLFVRKNRELELLEKLTGVTADTFSLRTMNDLTLVKLLSESENEMNEHPSSPTKITMNDQFDWLIRRVIPLINLINAHDSKDKQAMLAMVIIIAGEYCSGESCLAMRRYLKTRDDLPVTRSYFAKFMKLCRDIRNDLSHNIFEPEAEKIVRLLEMARTITPTLIAVEDIEDALIPVSTLPVAKLEVSADKLTAALK